MAGVPGSYAVVDWVAPECVRLLTNKLKAASYANFSFQDEFKRSFAVGENVRVRYPQNWNVVEGFAYQPQAITNKTFNVTIAQPMQISWEQDSFELALRAQRSEEEIRRSYVDPAMVTLANEYERRFMDFAFYNTPNVRGTMAAVPTAWATYASGRQSMVNLGGWGMSAKRGALVSTQMQATMIANSLTQFNPAPEISRQYKEGSIGMAAGFEWFETVACHRHTTGVWATVASGVTIDTSNQAGSSLVVLCTTGDTFKRGDTISIASVNAVVNILHTDLGYEKQFKVMADAVGVAGTATLSIYPDIIGPGSPYQNVSALPLTGAALTLMPGTTMVNGTAKTGTFGLEINDQSMAMAGIELYIPEEGGTVRLSKRAKDKETGISIAMVMGVFDPEQRKVINRIDSLIGFGNEYGDACGCLIASLT